MFFTFLYLLCVQAPHHGTRTMENCLVLHHRKNLGPVDNQLQQRYQRPESEAKLESKHGSDPAEEAREDDLVESVKPSSEAGESLARIVCGITAEVAADRQLEEDLNRLQDGINHLKRMN